MNHRSKICILTILPLFLTITSVSQADWYECRGHPGTVCEMDGKGGEYQLCFNPRWGTKCGQVDAGVGVLWVENNCINSGTLSGTVSIDYVKSRGDAPQLSDPCIFGQ